MDVTAPAHRLSAAVSAASRLLPARAGLRLAADAAGLTVAGSAPDLAVRFGCPATTHTDGSVVIPAAPLAETLKVLDTELVRLVVEGTRLALRLDNARFALPLLPETGVVPDPPAQVSEVAGAAFASALRIVAGTAAKDDPLPLFTGVRVQASGTGLTLTASDRYRMAVARLPLSSPGSLDVLVPAALLSEAARQARGRVGLHIGPGRFGVSWQEGLVATAVLDAGFLSEDSIPSGAVDTTVTPANRRSSRYAVIDTTRGVLGSCPSNKPSACSRSGARTKHTISVPPDIRLTHCVSSRRASPAAIAAAASGTHRSRTSQ
jgi:DNA polymerase-3 subunit beta